MLLSFPGDHAEVRQAETRAADAYFHRHGRPHPFLSEHAEFGLPALAEVGTMLHALGLSYFTVSNSPLQTWLPLLVLTEELNETPHPEILQSFSRSLNAAGGPFDTKQVPYRHFVAVFPTRRAAEEAEQHWRAASRPPSGKHAPLAGTLDPVVALAGQLRAVFLDHWHAMKTQEARAVQLGERLELHARSFEGLRREHEALAERLAVDFETARLLEEMAAELSAWQLRARTAEHQRDQLRSARLLAWWTKLRTWLRLRVGHTGVEDAHYCELDPLADGWLATGEDPRFMLPRAYPRGWLRVELFGLFPEGETPKLYYDRGNDFSEQDVVSLGPWPGGVARRVVYHWLEGPVRAVRFDPVESPGPFTLFRLRVKPVSRVRARLQEFLKRAQARWAAVTVRLPRLPALWRRLCRLWHGAGGRLRRRLFAQPAFTPNNYQAWLERETLTAAERDRIRARLAECIAPPRVALLLDARRGSASAVEQTLASLPRDDAVAWRLLIADSPKEAEAWTDRCKRAGLGPDRAMVLAVPPRASTAEAHNRLLEAAAEDFVAVVDAGDRLAEDALLWLADALAQRPAVDLAYTDEDCQLPGQPRQTPDFKPDWSPDYALERPYLGRLTVYRTQTVRRAGRFRTDCGEAHEYDMQLRITDPGGGNVLHVSRVLYHRCTPPARSRFNMTGETEAVAAAHRRRLPWAQPAPSGALPGRVSIVIPSGGKPLRGAARRGPAVLNCVESIRRRGLHQPLEILVVSSEPLPEETAEPLRQHGVRLLHYGEEFNFSRSVNIGAAAARGDYLLLLNDDTEVHTRDWLERMLEPAARPGVGAVGAKLLFRDGRIQHVGVLLLKGQPVHPWYGFHWQHRGYRDSTVVSRNFLAVTGACLLTPAAVFRKVQGFDPAFPMSYNDVDYCLRLRERGLRCVFTPHAVLFHYEGSSRCGGQSVQPWELERFRARWQERYPRDPFYNDNLSLAHIDYQLRQQDGMASSASRCRMRERDRIARKGAP